MLPSGRRCQDIGIAGQVVRIESRWVNTNWEIEAGSFSESVSSNKMSLSIQEYAFASYIIYSSCMQVAFGRQRRGALRFTDLNGTRGDYRSCSCPSICCKINPTSIHLINRGDTIALY